MPSSNLIRDPLVSHPHFYDFDVGGGQRMLTADNVKETDK